MENTIKQILDACHQVDEIIENTNDKLSTLQKMAELHRYVVRSVDGVYIGVFDLQDSFAKSLAESGWVVMLCPTEDGFSKSTKVKQGLPSRIDLVIYPEMWQ